jgi:putative nucleotidyltransferase with HDIG domain
MSKELSQKSQADSTFSTSSQSETSADPVIQLLGSAPSAEGKFKIRVNSLIPDRATTFDTFIMINGKMILYLRAGDSLTARKIHHLEKADVFYVPDEQRSFFKSYIFDRMNEAELDIKTKANVLRESSMTLAEEIFEKEDVEEALADSRELITNFVDFMEREPEAMAHLVGLSSHDFYTYNHSLDVAIYSLGLGKVIGFSGEELLELGRGALFHDIGKRHVKAEIICKQGPLDDVEWAQMQKHPQYGLKILNEHGVSEAMKACCFEHHESYLGNGYPQQLPGDEIHPMARIVAITDTYDALTTKRSYNEPMSPIAAVEFISTKLAAKYDPKMIKALNSILFKIRAVS